MFGRRPSSPEARSLVCIGALGVAAVLSSLALPRVPRCFPVLEKSESTALRLAAVRDAAGEFRSRHGVGPDRIELLAVPDPRNLDEPFLEAGGLRDAWGAPLIYVVAGDVGFLASLGADSRPGGKGEAADLVVTFAVGAR
ncbi:MAG: type II secretion system protein GspG [Planctomycetota bacterium JB042]